MKSKATGAAAESPAEASTARALPVPADDARDWYGWQLLIVDGAVFAGFGAMERSKLRDGATLGTGFGLLLVYDVVPPLIHWRHDRWRIAWASFGLRALMPSAVLLGALLVSDCGSEGTTGARACLNRHVRYGAWAGFVATSAIDASLFAWDAPVLPPRRDAGVQWAPLLAPREGGATLGVTGAF